MQTKVQAALKHFLSVSKNTRDKLGGLVIVPKDL